MAKTKKIGVVKVVSKGIGLLYFEPARTVIGKGHLMPASSIMEVRPYVPFDILVYILSNITVHEPKCMVLFSSSESMIIIIDP